MSLPEPSKNPNPLSNGGSSVYEYEDQWQGKPRPIRIIVIGAGLSGIAAAKLFRDRFTDQPTTLTIYEKNHDVGGTWLENRYPGCSCDIPAHGYTFSWEGNPQWSKAYVGSVELFDYFKGRATTYGIHEYLRLQNRVNSAKWDEESGMWKVEIEDIATQRVFVDAAEVVINACGFLNNWKWPEIHGIASYQGFLIHSAKWDDSFSFKGKSVAIIGSGSSAIQIAPIIQRDAKSMVSFNRSPTWITPEFGAEFAPKGRDASFSEEEKRTWVEDPEMFLKYRKTVENAANHYFDLQHKDSLIQKTLYNQFQQSMRDRLGNKDDLAAKLIPEFAVGCRRMTPGHGYLEALSADNVTVRNDQILKIVPEGIEMTDGTKFVVDAIICATGFDTSYRPAFPVIGSDGKNLRDEWALEPRSYLSVAANGFPNYFMASGPNFPLTNGSLIPCLEATISYAFDAAYKIQCQGIKSLSPKRNAVDDFQKHKDALMKDLVWTSSCRSWYKNGKIDGKVWGPWCGSSLHFLQLMRSPRWEDWDISHVSSNRFQYLGNGRSDVEANSGDYSWYIM